jgi:hypothetical protein
MVPQQKEWAGTMGHEEEASDICGIVLRACDVASMNMALGPSRIGSPTPK